MKTITLQEKYNRDKVQVLLEQLDLADLQNITSAFDRIDSIIGPLDNKLPAISGQIEKARQELAEIMAQTGRGARMQNWPVLWRIVKRRKGKALQSIMEAQIQLVSLFRALPGVMTLAGKNVKGKLSTAVEGGLTADVSLAKVLADDPSASKNMQNLIAKSLKPAQIGRYPIDANAAASDLMNLSVKEFAGLANRAGSAEIKVPVSPEEAKEMTSPEEGEEAEEPGGKAQQLLQKLKADPETAKLTRNYLDIFKGMGQKDFDLLKKGLDRMLGSSTPEGEGATTA